MRADDSDDSPEDEKPSLEAEQEERMLSRQEGNLLFLFFSPSDKFRGTCSRFERRLQCLPILKDIFVVLRPTSTWNCLVARQKGVAFVFLFYFLPMLLLLAVVEGFGLILLGRAQQAEGMHNRFAFPNVVAYEIGSILLDVSAVYVAARLIKSLANAYHARNNLSQSLLVMLYAIGPMYLVQLLNGFPDMFWWLTWLAGMLLTIGALYNGLPRILEPDPPSAMGLFVGSAVIVILLTLGKRLLTGFYLSGYFKPFEQIVNQVAQRLF